MICPNCGKDGGDGAFCIYCGNRFPADAAAPQNEAPAKDIPAEPVEEEAACPTGPVNGFETPAPKPEPAFKPASATEQTAEPKKAKKAGKWSVIIPILLLLAFGAALLALISGAVSIIGRRIDFLRIHRFFPEIFNLSFFPLVGAVLFFLHTKKKAILTAIPYFVYIIPALVLAATEIGYMKGTREWYSIAYDLFYMLIPLISIALAVIYGIGVSVKKKTNVFVELYIIGAAAALTMLAVMNIPSCFSVMQYAFKEMDLGDYMKMYGCRQLYDFFAWFTAFFTHIACVLALKEKAKEN